MTNTCKECHALSPLDCDKDFCEDCYHDKNPSGSPFCAEAVGLCVACDQVHMLDIDTSLCSGCYSDEPMESFKIWIKE